jgi:hypothetical protein
VKNRILLSSNLDIIVLALFSALTGLSETFNFLFLSTIIHSPSGVALIPRILVVYIVPTSLLNTKAIGVNIRNNLDLNLSTYFTLAISLYFAGHAWDHNTWSPTLHAAQYLLIACEFSVHCSIICCPPQKSHRNRYILTSNIIEYIIADAQHYIYINVISSPRKRNTRVLINIV